ncbi:hypothetical protein Hanom_Chr04g00290381 [Helianthus anomalus]
MASKAGESSSAQTGSDALYCKWGPVSYNNLVQEYNIRLEWNPVLPSKTDTTFPLKKGKITLYRLVKLHHFEFTCIALGHIPEITVFRAFFILVWKSPFFTFDRRDVDVSFLRDIPISSRDKEWKKKFFYIEANVIPGGMQWREMGAKDKFKDDVIPEGALVMVGMSLLWQDIRLYPSFQRDDEETKKPIRVKVTGRKYMDSGPTTSSVAVSVSVRPGGAAVTFAAADLVSPPRAQKKCRVVPPLTAFQAIQAAHALPTSSIAEVQVEGVSSMPLTSGDVVFSATSRPSLSDLIS